MGRKGDGSVNRQFFNTLVAQCQSPPTNLLNLDSREVVNFGANDNTSKRSFTGKGIIKGYSYNNYYNQQSVTSFEKFKSGFSFANVSNQNAYGIGFDLRSAPNISYAVRYDGLMETTRSAVFMTEYDIDGNLLKYVLGGERDENIKARVFTTGENTAWVVFSFQNPPDAGTSTVVYNDVSITLVS